MCNSKQYELLIQIIYKYMAFDSIIVYNVFLDIRVPSLVREYMTQYFVVFLVMMDDE